MGDQFQLTQAPWALNHDILLGPLPVNLYPTQHCKPFEDRYCHYCFPNTALRLGFTGSTRSVIKCLLSEWKNAWAWLKHNSWAAVKNVKILFFLLQMKQTPLHHVFSSPPGVLFDPHKNLVILLGRECTSSQSEQGSQHLWLVLHPYGFTVSVQGWVWGEVLSPVRFKLKAAAHMTRVMTKRSWEEGSCLSKRPKRTFQGTGV